ncbi:MAG: T9SS type A sorting domain-containing protein [Bacteroidales bacterium]|nr:T9SS type A sorting domain-containing protein [Bacteroidales bacterium]
MKRISATLFMAAMVLNIFAQKNFRKEMIESGERPEQISKEFKSHPTDYKSFKRTKAWNSFKAGSSVFSNTAEVDVSIIGGRVRSSLVDKDNNIALVAPSGGGIWNFDPVDGSSFTPLDDFGSFLSITSLAQDPYNPKTILAATGDEQHSTVGNGIFKSTDGGKSFSLISSTNPDNNIDFKYIRFVKFSPNKANVIYLAAKTKLYKSTNAGASWTKVFNGRANIRSIDFLENDRVVIGVSRIGIYISEDGNADSFSLVKNTIPFDKDEDGRDYSMGGFVAASCASDRSICYVFYAAEDPDDGNKEIGHVYKSENNGQTWEEVTKPSFYVSQSFFCHTIGVHPTNPDIVIAGSVGWGYSTDGGTTWVKAAELEVDFHDVHFHSSDPNVAFIGYDQGIGRVDFSKTKEYRIWNGSKYVYEEQFEQKEIGKNPGFNTSQIYYGDFYPEAYGDAIIYGQQDGGCFAKVNGIERRIMVGDGGAVFINKQDPNKAFASTQSGTIRKATAALKPNYYDYKNVTALTGTHAHWITHFEGNNADGKQVYIPQKTTIERTVDTGNTFTSIAQHGLSSLKIAVENKVNPVVYGVGYDSKDAKKLKAIRISNAATSNYSSKVVTLSDKYIKGADHVNIAPDDNNTIYVANYDGDAYKFSNLNSTPTMESINGDIPDVVFNTIIGVKNTPQFLIAGTNIGVFYSQDGGSNWYLSDEFPYTKIMDIKLRESDNRLFVFTYGRGTWASTLKLSPATVVENNKDEEISIIPNIANRTIEINAKDLAGYAVSIFNMNGSMVIQTKDINLIDINSLSAGAYILHVTGQGRILDVCKFVID